MGFSCFRKPAVDEDFAPVGAAPAGDTNGHGGDTNGHINGLSHLSPLPGKRPSDAVKLATPRSSFDLLKDLMGSPSATIEPAASFGRLPGQDGDGPWWGCTAVESS
jgi:hypothetical protein